MRCREALALTEDFREGAMPASLEQAFEAHLGQCRKCRTALAEMDMADREFRAAFARFGPRPGFEARVMAELEQARAEPRRARMVSAWVKPALIAAASLLAAFCGLRIWRGGYEGSMRGSPVCGAGRAISAPFVIGENGIRPYQGKARLSIRNPGSAAPELIVDAFAD